MKSQVILLFYFFFAVIKLEHPPVDALHPVDGILVRYGEESTLGSDTGNEDFGFKIN